MSLAPAPRPLDVGAAPVIGPVPRTEVDIARVLHGWQRELGTVGGPNSLLWLDDTQTMLDLTVAHPGGIAMLLSDRPTTLGDLYRERTAYSEAFDRAGVLRTKAAELEEEHGLASLFLASGLVTLPIGRRTVAAPILLRTCDLVPVEDDLQLVVGAVVEVNPALLDLFARLGMPLDAQAIADAAHTRSGVDPTLAAQEVERQTADLADLIATSRLVLSTFTYSKAALASDLAQNAERWSALPLVRALAGEARESQPLPAIEADADLADERLVLDLDAEQARVVECVRRGRDVVVEAPAATGATQVVAATLAALDGSALLVAPSRCAADAVVQRLADIGLGDLVVRADDDPRSRRRVVADVLALVRAPNPAAKEPDARRVAGLRHRLLTHHDSLHRVREPWGVSAYEAQNAIATLCASTMPPTCRTRLAPDVLARTSLDDARRLGAALAVAAGQGAWRGGSSEDPWYGARIGTAQEATLARVVLQRLLGPEGLDRAARLVRAMDDEAHLTPSSTVAQWRADIEAVAGVRATTDVFTLAVYDAHLPELLAATSASYRAEHGPQLGLLARASRTRQARALLRPGPPPADLHRELVLASEQVALWRERSGPAARPRQAPSLDDARAAVEGVRADLGWLGPRLDGTAVDQRLDELPIEELRVLLRRLHERVERAAVVPGVVGVLDRARAAGLGDLVDELARRDACSAAVAREVEFVWWATVLDAIRREDPTYGGHDGAALRRLREEYRTADAALVAGRAPVRRAAALARLQRAAAAHPAQVQALHAALDGVTPLARLWDVAGDVLGAVPVWACTPGALPAVVPASAHLDTCVVVDAHAMSTAVAVGALARCSTVLAIGDPAGPPPSPYQAAAGIEAHEDDIDLVGADRSVLTALRPALPVVELRVAYGRKDSRLASPVTSVVHLPCPGGVRPLALEVVDSPGSGVVSPDAEVERVARLVVAHCRSGSTRSLAVVTVTEGHAARIRACLPDGLADLTEPLLVVPAHRLAGRRRDDVIFAPGFAVAHDGPSLHRFGVLRLGGGERLVHAAMSAARRSVIVVTSLTTVDLGAERDPDDGVGALRAVLAVLEAPSTGLDASPGEVRRVGAAGPLQRDLARRIAATGAEVAQGVGPDGFGIDVVVRRPRRPADGPVAVTTDAADLSGLPGVRSRVRLWPALLAHRGWQPVELSTIDLFAAPEPEVARVLARLEGR